MFKSKAFTFLIIIFALLALVTPAQKINIDKNDNAVLITMEANVDSLSTVTSKWFSIPEYLTHSLYTYPVNYTKMQNSVSGKPYITVTVEGSNDQVNVAVIDTIGGVQDSLETLYSGNTNFNNKKFWYYRIKFKGESKSGSLKNRKDATLRTDLLFVRPKN